MVADDHQGEGIATLDARTPRGDRPIERHRALHRRGARGQPGDARRVRQGRLAAPATIRVRRRRSRLGTRHDRGVPRQRRAPRTTRRLASGRPHPAPPRHRRDRRVAPRRLGRRGALAPRGVERHGAEVRRQPVATRATIPTSGTRRSTNSPTRCRSRSSPCRPSSSMPPSTPASASACGARSWSPRSTEPTSTSRPWSCGRDATGCGSSGPSSMGIASPRPESLLQAALVDVALPAGQRRHLDAVRVARQFGAPPGPRPPARSLVVRVARRQGRHLGQRSAAVLGGGRQHLGRRDVHRVVRQSRASSPASPAGCR